MKVEELRIGNWVEIDRGYCKVVSLSTPAYSEWNKGDDYCIIVQSPLNGTYWECTKDEVNGIPIAPLGYVDKINQILTKPDMPSADGRFSTAYYVFDGYAVETKYIHELQNVYFSDQKEEIDLDSLFK